MVDVFVNPKEYILNEPDYPPYHQYYHKYFDDMFVNPKEYKPNYRSPYHEYVSFDDVFGAYELNPKVPKKFEYSIISQSKQSQTFESLFNVNFNTSLYFPLYYPLSESNDMRMCALMNKIRNPKMLALTYLDPEKEGKEEKEKNVSEFDKFLISKDIPSPCKCIKEEVEKCFNNYYVAQKIEHRGIKNIIDVYFKLCPELSYDGIVSLCDILIMILNKTRNIYHSLCDYTKIRFGISYSETHCILAYLDMMNYLSHNYLLRCPSISKLGMAFLIKHRDITKCLEPIILKRLDQKRYNSYLPKKWIKHDKKHQQIYTLDLTPFDFDNNDFDDIETSVLFSHVAKKMDNESYINDINIEINVYLVKENEVNEYLTGLNELQGWGMNNAIYKISKDQSVNFLTFTTSNGSSGSGVKKIYINEAGNFFDEKKMKLQCNV